jgi:hypothetical protein
MEEENKKGEKNIIIVRDVMENPGRFEESFFCPKCNSSLICLWDKYAANNTANSMEKNMISWMKLIVKCDNCGHGDLILKFLKEREDRFQYAPTTVASPYNLTTSGMHIAPTSKHKHKLWGSL